jgi:MFS transporter, MHS family, citrate/tricarballylate:H+ symporter
VPWPGARIIYADPGRLNSKHTFFLGIFTYRSRAARPPIESLRVSTPTPSAHLPARQVAGVVAANAIEFYDFVTYAFFATQIGRTFFPSDEPGISLLASLATFGAGFLTRPLGAFFIGRYADRAGRKPAMLLSFWLMGVAVVGLPLVPSYASIGLAAPLLVIAFRLLQGFALGGEVGPSTAFLMEAAPPHRRGFYVSLQATSADFAVMVASLVGVLLAVMLSKAELDAWGWRIALLAGAVIIPFGLMLRRSMMETLHRAPPVVTVPETRPASLVRIGLVSVALIATATTTNYLLSYMKTYAGFTLGLPESFAFGATVAVGAAGLIFDPLGGWLSDRFGRRRLILLPWLLLAVLVFPGFWAIEHFRTGPVLWTVCAVLASIQTAAGTTALVSITEWLPRSVRAGGFGLIYASSIAVFGGSTQFMTAWLTRLTGDPLVPAWYMMGFIIVGLLALSQLPETAPARTGRVAD